MKIAANSVVAIHYTLTNEAGETLDSSANSEPLSYLHGNQGLIPGLEAELEGREAGDTFQVAVQPEEAYGRSNEALIQEVPLDALAQIENLTVGMQLQAQGPDGQVQTLLVEKIGDESATLNANHPLADQVLNFDVKVESVREASAEELEHGHAH